MIAMNIQEFSAEIASQDRIIRYIEVCCFEEEYGKTQAVLELPHREVGEIYSNTAEFIDELKLKCQNAQDALSVQHVPVGQIPDWVYKTDAREPLGELISYCVDYIEYDDYDPAKIECDIKKLIKDNQDQIYTEDDIQKAIRVAPMLYSAKLNEQLDEQENNISRLMATVDLLDTRLNTNIYRQSFISLFSIFDAYVFDYLKAFFTNNADQLETFFKTDTKEKTKLSVEEVLKFGSLVDLKSSIVEQRFDGKYIKQILCLVRAHKPQVFYNIDYPKMMEMVNRRNIHIHNRGYADARYIENFNIYGLDHGDYAQISKQYFLDACAILHTFLQNMETEYQ